MWIWFLPCFYEDFETVEFVGPGRWGLVMVHDHYMISATRSHFFNSLLLDSLIHLLHSSIKTLFNFPQTIFIASPHISHSFINNNNNINSNGLRIDHPRRRPPLPPPPPRPIRFESRTSLQSHFKLWHGKKVLIFNVHVIFVMQIVKER